MNSWGGPWLDAAKANLFDPFTAATGVKIEPVSAVSFAKLAAQVKTGVYEFDVTTLGAAELLRAEEAGLIEPVAEPYPGGLFHGGAASHAFTTVIGYNGKKFADGPNTWADFWDVEKFPGARSLQRYPARILPLALLADGVPVDQIYPMDIDRAFKSLDRIKEHVVVWWTAGAQSSQLLRDGTFVTALTVTVFCLIVGFPLAYLMSVSSRRVAMLILLLITMSFWTSFLVRTFAWMVILGNGGPLVSFANMIGWTDPPRLLFTRFASTLAMVQMLAPYMIVNIYTVMQKIDPALIRSAKSMGAKGTSLFRHVYLPLSAAGIANGAGCSQR